MNWEIVFHEEAIEELKKLEASLRKEVLREFRRCPKIHFQIPKVGMENH